MITIKERLESLKPRKRVRREQTENEAEHEKQMLEKVSNGFVSLKDRILKKEFILDNQNLPTIIFLHYYFADSPFLFDDHYPKHSLKKGLLITGNCGTGKTAILRIFKHIVMYHKRNAFTITSANQVIRDYDSNGSECLEKYIIRKYLFDDFGSENKGKYYGKEEEVFKTLIEERYNRFIENGLRTHLTSNLTLSQIKERYGDRVYSRLHEMFNIIVLDGKDRRI